MKKGQKAGFLSPRSSKIIVTKEKERRKRKSEEKGRRKRKKSNGCTPSFYSSYFVGHAKKVLLAITLSKNRLDLRNGKRAACNHGFMDARGRLLSTKEA